MNVLERVPASVSGLVMCLHRLPRSVHRKPKVTANGYAPHRQLSKQSCFVPLVLSIQPTLASLFEGRELLLQPSRLEMLPARVGSLYSRALRREPEPEFSFRSPRQESSIPVNGDIVPPSALATSQQGHVFANAPASRRKELIPPVGTQAFEH